MNGDGKPSLFMKTVITICVALMLAGVGGLFSALSKLATLDVRMTAVEKIADRVAENKTRGIENATNVKHLGKKLDDVADDVKELLRRIK